MGFNGNVVGIILQTKEFKENDSILSFYSKEYGKIDILVRGSRNITSKLAPIISEPFALLKLKIVNGKHHFHLIGGQKEQSFKQMLNDYSKVIKIKFLFSKIDQLIKIKKPEEKILFLIIKFLNKFSKLDKYQSEIIFFGFLIKLLSFLGYRPEISHCVICEKIKIGEQIYFDLEKGGIVCKNHQLLNEHIIQINQDVLQMLKKLLYKDFDYLQNQEFNKKDFLLTSTIIKKFLLYHTL